MTDRWDPGTYLGFADQRSRPFHDLLARVECESPHVVVDLGCGPGTLTELLAHRWPEAHVTGVDSSARMIVAARERRGPVNLSFEHQDLREWQPGPPVDLLVSSSALQWVPEHLDLIPWLVDRIRPGGWFAMQVPGNFDEPSHTLRRELMSNPPYAFATRDLPEPHGHDAVTYADLLHDLGCDVEAWETTYLHELTGPDPVFRWISSTSAAPALEALEPLGLREPFERELRERLAEAYPARAGRVLMPFRRVFAVARPR